MATFHPNYSCTESDEFVVYRCCGVSDTFGPLDPRISYMTNTADVVLVCPKGKTILTHRSVLNALSPALATLLANSATYVCLLA